MSTNYAIPYILQNSGRILDDDNKCLWSALYQVLRDEKHLLVLDGHPVDLETFYCEIKDFLSMNYSAFQGGPAGLRVLKETGQEAFNSLRQADTLNLFQESDNFLIIWSLLKDQIVSVTNKRVQVEFLRTRQELMNCVPKRNTVFIFHNRFHFEGVVFKRGTEVPVFKDPIDTDQEMARKLHLEAKKLYRGQEMARKLQLNRDQEMARKLQQLNRGQEMARKLQLNRDQEMARKLQQLNRGQEMARQLQLNRDQEMARQLQLEVEKLYRDQEMARKLQQQEAQIQQDRVRAQALYKELNGDEGPA